MKRAVVALATVALALAAAQPAGAHLNVTGVGPFYDGIVHFALSPEDIGAVVALALLAGLRGPAFARRMGAA